MTAGHDQIHGYYLQDLMIGMKAEYSKIISEADVLGFAEVSGDINPLHLDEEFAVTTRAGQRIAHGMLSASLISTIVGTRLPGPGCLYMGQDLRFLAPVVIGDTVTAVAVVESIDRAKSRITLNTVCRVADKDVIQGSATVWVPRREQSG